ncbi:hypothetical protein POTOM_034607 [Populus tomentosa]|uniref:Uncharacterized protein n=1 Tax=Populus tomentosa TaxID=118781 RepID=A0A8X8CPH2_POPTO|nr:hypothetical protein POTOM_034607 [Populus tomentosa]
MWANMMHLALDCDSFCAKRLCSVSCTNWRSRVGFPSPTELVKRNDCKSASNDEVQDDSIAVQIVVDSSSRILSVVAGFRGDKDGSRILKPTTLCHDAEARRLLNSTFLVHLHASTFRALCLKRTLYQSFICQATFVQDRPIVIPPSLFSCFRLFLAISLLFEE